MTSPTYITQYCNVQSWYMRKRIDHWCSVVPEKSQCSGQQFSGKLGKPRFPLGPWALGIWIFLSPLNINDRFYLSRTPDRDFHCFYTCEIILSHIPTHTRLSDSDVCSLLEKSVLHRYPCAISVTNYINEISHTPPVTFLAHDCIPSKTKVELLSVRKKFNVEFSVI